MPVRVGINGFGRIGRNVFRAAQAKSADIEWVAVNDLTDAKTLAHLLKYDSILGPLPGHGRGRRATASSSTASRCKVLAERDPADLPWGDLGVDVVIESTGFFTDRDNAAKHLDGGAKKVIISAPAKGEDITVVLGVNFDKYDTRPARRHLQRVVHDELPGAVGQGRQRRGRHQARPDDDDPRVHGRTRTCRTRRTRTCAAPAPPRSTSCPTSTGAAKAVGLVLPELNGKLHGFAVRAPVPTGSRRRPDLRGRRARRASRRSTRRFKAAADRATSQGILQLHRGPDRLDATSSTNPYSSIVDGGLTAVSTARSSRS